MQEPLGLIERIDADLKDAMRARDDVTKLTLRSVKAALTEASKEGSAHTLDDQAALGVIRREAKRRRDAAAEYDTLGSPERAAQELAELAVLERYLPQQLVAAEIEVIARAVLAELNASSMADMGKVMAAMMSRVGNRADGKAVNQVIRQMLSK